MFGKGFPEVYLEDPWKPLLLIGFLLHEVIQNGGWKVQHSSLWIMPVFHLIVSCTTFSGNREQHHSFLLYLKWVPWSQNHCAGTFLIWATFDPKTIDALFLHWFCFGRRGETAILNYCCFHHMGKFEICHLEDNLKCIFHILEWHNTILKNVESSSNSLPLLQAWFQK